MKNAWIRMAAASLLFLSAGASAMAQNDAGKPAGKTRNVVLIVADGLRWQEIFTGADATLLNSKDGGVWDKPEDLRKEFWREEPAERRAALFPFLWGTVAKRGQIFGNQNKGSVGRVTNGMAFSYPGYNEMLTGFPDGKIDSNEFGTNPNMTVFEWLNKDPEFHGQVAVFATWSTFRDIFNQQRSHLAMQVGWDEPYHGTVTPREEMLNQLYRETIQLDSEDVYDSFLQPPLLDFVKARHPRVLFVGYGETDNWAHSGRYDLVLRSAHEFDRYVQQLWETMQARPEYRDQTTFVITTDHGRGSGLVEWKDHGVDQKGSENIWIAVLGPDTEPLGERTRTNPVTQAQIAATLATLLGKNYRSDVLPAAPPIEDVLTKHAAAAAQQP
jgi:Metalloenzyme superfamily